MYWIVHYPSPPKTGVAGVSKKMHWEFQIWFYTIVLPYYSNMFEQGWKNCKILQRSAKKSIMFSQFFNFDQIWLNFNVQFRGVIRISTQLRQKYKILTSGKNYFLWTLLRNHKRLFHSGTAKKLSHFGYLNPEGCRGGVTATTLWEMHQPIPNFLIFFPIWFLLSSGKVIFIFFC